MLIRYGFELDRISGSHHLFVYRQGQKYRSIGIPLHGRKVKRVYIETILELLNELFPLEADSPESKLDDQDS